MVSEIIFSGSGRIFSKSFKYVYKYDVMQFTDFSLE